MTRKQRLLTLLFPVSFGAAYRQAVIDSLEDALAEIEAGGRRGSGRWCQARRRFRVWTDFFKTGVQERGTELRRALTPDGLSPSPYEPAFPRSPRSNAVVSSFFQDFAFAVRSFRKSPAFTAVAVATIALGIGANTAIFSVVNGVLLRPLPFEDEDSLVMVRGRWPVRNVEKAGISTGNLADFIRDTTAFAEFAAIVPYSAPVTGADVEVDPEQIRAANVTHNFFTLVGIEPAIGRSFTADDTPDTVIISHDLWQRRFAGDDNILDQTLRLGDRPMTITGVLTAGLIVPIPEQRGVPATDVDVWKLQDWDLNAETANRNRNFLRVFARLAPGATMVQAQQQADAVAAESRRLYADAARVNTQFDVLTVHSQVVDTVESTLFVFMAAVGFVLLIACANVANLLLVRSKVRERELAVRAALGAGRGRLLRQQLIESLTLALAGAAGGLAIAYGSIEALLWFEPADLPRIDGVGIDAMTLGFSLGLAVLTAVIFGLLPAAQAAGASLTDSLRAGGCGASGARKRLGRTLIVAEVALSMILLVGAGLLARSFVSLASVSPGFDIEGTLSFRAAVIPDRYADFLDQVGALPGVTSVAGASVLPLSGSLGHGPFVPDTIAWEDTSSYPASLRRFVTPGYFEALGIGLVRGRLFEKRDLDMGTDGGPPPFVVVDEKLAARIWGDADPVGRTVRRAPAAQPGPALEVLGVVENIRQESLQEDGPGTIYHLVPAQSRFVVSSSVTPETLVGPIRSVLASAAPGVPMHEVQTIRSYVDQALAPARFTMALAGVFALSALLLAAVGLYGVISYAVSQRSREMGIRLALGAHRSNLLTLVVGDGIKLTMAGVALGLIGAFLVSRLLSAWLYEVAPTDPLTYATVTVLLLGVSALACYVPARRAARADPVVTLRS